MKRGRPKKMDITEKIDPIKNTNFDEYDDLITTYIRLVREAVCDPETPDNYRTYYIGFLSLERYLMNLLILKAEFKDTKKVAEILNMKDDVYTVSSTLSYAKRLIKKQIQKISSDEFTTNTIGTHKFGMNIKPSREESHRKTRISHLKRSKMLYEEKLRKKQEELEAKKQQIIQKIMNNEYDLSVFDKPDSD